MWLNIYIYIYIFRISLEQSTHLHDYLQFSTSKLAAGKAKGPEFLSRSCHSRGGSRGKEDLLLTTQYPIGSPMVRGWFPEYLPTILLDPKKVE
jgi:hypothetical protein